MADFFTPAKLLLSAAPLVMTRGNHENCDKGQDWMGWFRYFAFGPALTRCDVDQGRFTAPYAVSLTPDRQLVVMDTSASKDKLGDSTKEYIGELNQVNLMANVGGMQTFLVSHVPFWEIKHKGNGADAGNDPDDAGGPAVLEAALQGTKYHALFNSIVMILSGDLHQFEYLSFVGTNPVQLGDRPPQLILGDGGTLMSNPNKGPFKCVDGDDNCTAANTVSAGEAEADFGFGVITLGSGQKTSVAVERIKNGSTTWKKPLHCTLTGWQLDCG